MPRLKKNVERLKVLSKLLELNEIHNIAEKWGLDPIGSPFGLGLAIFIKSTYLSSGGNPARLFNFFLL